MRGWWRGWIVVWCAALATVPVPYTGVEHGWVPSAWLLVVAGVAATIGAVEGGTVPWQLAGVLGAQALVATIALGVVARLLVPRLEALVPGGPPWAVAAGMVVVLGIVAMCDVYRSPIAGNRWTHLAGIWG